MKYLLLKLCFLFLTSTCFSQVYNNSIQLKNQEEITKAFSKGGALENINSNNVL